MASSMTKSVLKLARLSLHIAQASLPAYAHKFSPKRTKQAAADYIGTATEVVNTWDAQVEEIIGMDGTRDVCVYSIQGRLLFMFGFEGNGNSITVYDKNSMFPLSAYIYDENLTRSFKAGIIDGLLQSQ